MPFEMQIFFLSLMFIADCIANRLLVLALSYITGMHTSSALHGLLTAYGACTTLAGV